MRSRVVTRAQRAAQLKAYLDYHKIPYKVVEVNPLTKKELKWSTYGKVSSAAGALPPAYTRLGLCHA